MDKITLATLPQATPQQVFDQVARHMLAQGERSMQADSNRCAYRGIEGRSCAAGCLIDDSEYNADWEDMRWHQLAADGRVPSNHLKLIERLQNTHDLWVAEDWRERLGYVAGSFGLSTAVLEVVNG